MMIQLLIRMSNPDYNLEETPKQITGAPLVRESKGF